MRPEGLISYKEAGELAGCHPLTVRRAVDAGKLVAIPLPSLVKIWLREDEVRKWAESRAPRRQLADRCSDGTS